MKLPRAQQCLSLECQLMQGNFFFNLFVTLMDRISKYSPGLDSVQFENNRVACLLFIADSFIEP